MALALFHVLLTAFDAVLPQRHSRKMTRLR
jgi:hypothetical protein